MRKVLSSALVGRDDELQLLDDALKAAAAGRGSTVVLSGEAGIGKSRLAREVQRLAVGRGMRTMWGRAGQGGGSFRALAEALESSAAVIPSDPALDAYRAALECLVPAWGGGTAAAAGEAHLLVPEATLRLLRALADERPVLMVLEDLHWADADTLRVVDYLSDRLASASVLCLLTERSDTPGLAAEVLADMVARRSAARLLLGPLEAPAVEAMARQALGVESPPVSLLGALRTRAEGVPFLIEELLAAFVEAAGSSDSERGWWAARPIAGGLPPSFRALTRARLDALDPAARRVVSAAAVLGRTFDGSLIGPTVGLEPNVVTDGLRLAARAQLLSSVRTAEGGWGFAFRHALAREAVAAELPPEELQALCSAAAEAIEDARPGLPGEWCERAAELRVAAGDRLGASRLLEESGRRAFARGAIGTAESALVRARDLVLDDHMAWMGPVETLLEVLAEAGKSERLVEAARGVLEAFEAYTVYGPNAVPAARMARLRLHVARAALLEGDLWLAAEQAEAAFALVADARPADRVPCEVMRARIALARHDADGAATLATAAHVAAGDAGLNSTMADALEVVGRAAMELGRLDQARAAFEAMESEASTSGRLAHRIRALVELGTLDRIEEAGTARLATARDLAVAAGAVSAVARTDLELARSALDDADLDAARSCLDRADDAARQCGLAILPAVAAARVLRHALGGDDAQAGEARAAAEEGDDDWARSTLRVADAIADPVAGDVRDVLVALRDSTPLGAPGRTALDAFADAVSLGRSGRGTDAAARAEGGRGRPSGWRGGLSHLLLARAAAADGWGEPGVWASDAMERFELAGLNQLAAPARAIMRREGIPVPRRGRGTAEVPASLRALRVTSREMDVLLLVGEGRSNQAIAERLFISPRTVESHVGSLMRRAGVQSRPELVAFANAAHA